MNTVLNSYGQLCGCPEILKKSYKFFCRGLDIRVSQIMNPYTFYACGFCSPVHLMMQITLCDHKNTILLFYSIKLAKILLHFLTKKFRHFNCTIALFCFRCSNHILSMQTLIRFVNHDSFFLKIKIPSSQR